MSKSIEPSMMLISGVWNSVPTFRMIPVTKECPYVEGLFDPAMRVLVLMSPEKKESLHMVPRLDENGMRIKIKGTTEFKEQRITLQTFQEYYVSKPEEIEDVISKLAINPEFDYKVYLTPPTVTQGVDAPVETVEPVKE